MATQQTQQKQAKPKGTTHSSKKTTNDGPNSQPRIPEHELKQNSGVSASMALQAMQKAWDLRQAANAAGDPDAREKILAKAINKEIEAESFGKAAKYTRSGAFQGLAAGAGLGVQPGVTIGKLTGALVGGVVSTVTGLLGGGIGSVYGAMNGPFWDLGEMASQGVRGVVGDFPNWKSTPAQQKALEKMVMQTKETQAPTKEELEQMKADAPDDMPQSWSQTTKDMTSWRPSMPSMPNMPSMPSMPQGAALGLGGLGASMPSWGGQNKSQNQAPAQSQPSQGASGQNQKPSQVEGQQPKPSSRQTSKQESQKPQNAPKPKEAPTPKEAPKLDNPQSQQATTSDKTLKPQTTSQPKASTNQPKAAQAKETSTPRPTSTSKTAQSKESSKPQTSKKPPTPSQPQKPSASDGKENKAPAVADGERKKPRKLGTKSNDAQPSQQSAPKKAPRKLAPRKPAT